jgi:hypothetical protein
VRHHAKQHVIEKLDLTGIKPRDGGTIKVRCAAQYPGSAFRRVLSDGSLKLRNQFGWSDSTHGLRQFRVGNFPLMIGISRDGC